MPYMDDLDIARLIRARLYDTARSASEVSREVYGKGAELSGVLSGSRNLSAKGFLGLVSSLRVDGDLLRLWVAAFLVSRTPGFLRIVEQTGLLAGAPLEMGAVELAELEMDREPWRAFSRVEASGRLRHQLCQQLADGGRYAATALGARVGERPQLVRTALRDLRKMGLVRSLARTERVRGLHAEHNARLLEWELTQKGVKLLGELELRKAS